MFYLSLVSHLLKKDFFNHKIKAMSTEKRKITPEQVKGIIDFVGQLIVRTFSGRPKFFKIAQYISIACAVIVGIIGQLDGIIPPEHVWDNYLLVILVSLAASFQLPVKDA